VSVASPDTDPVDALLQRHGVPETRRAVVRARALGTAQKMEALATGLSLDDEPATFCAALRLEAAARAR